MDRISGAGPALVVEAPDAVSSSDTVFTGLTMKVPNCDDMDCAVSGAVGEGKIGCTLVAAAGRRLGRRTGACSSRFGGRTNSCLGPDVEGRSPSFSFGFGSWSGARGIGLGGAIP